jgi:hemolysin activation/secretion protein
VDAALDTRVDPVFPRNAVLASVTWERFGYSGPLAAADGGDPAATRTGSFSRTTTDLQGYLGLWKANVFAVRARLATSSEPPPPYEQLLLGGTSSLRGYDLGYRAGDNLAAVSTELRMPITSPVSVARLGLKGFYDWGTVYPLGAKLADQRFDAGYGGGMFLTATVLSMGFDVAWRHTGGVNFHFSMGVKLGR